MRRLNARLTFAMAVGSVYAAGRVGASASRWQQWHATVRGASSSAVDAAATASSAVDVEAFTLNQAIVDADMLAAAEWKEFGAQLEALRNGTAAGASLPSLVSHIESGFALLSRLGEGSGPVQCRLLLLMELVAAQSGMGNIAGALEALTKAEAEIRAPTTATATQKLNTDQRNEGRAAQLRELRGSLLLQDGKYHDALKTFEDLLTWIDVGSARSLPFVRVEAQDMKRNILTGKGMALIGQAAEAAAAGRRNEVAEDHRKLAAKALDAFIDALALHNEKEDPLGVTLCLHGAAKSFALVGDREQAKATFAKFDAWISRHKEGTLRKGESIDTVPVLVRRAIDDLEALPRLVDA